MEAHVREWKTRRALIRGSLRGDREDVKALKAEAAQHREAGMGWFVDGFDGVETAEILSALGDVGITTGEEAFRAYADELPGPHEVAERWSGEAQLTDPRHGDLLWLAARALWARWLPDVMSLETAADALEEAITEFEASETPRSGDGALPALKRLVDLSEGERLVASALAEELPFRLWAWVLELLRDTRDAEDLGAWGERVDELSVLFPSEPVLRLLHARFLAHHDASDEAKAEIERALSGGAPESYQLCHAAQAHLALGDSDEALAFGKRALLLADDEADEEEAIEILRRALEALGRSGEHAEMVESIHAERRRDALARRKQRRKKDRKKGRKRR